MGKWGVSVVEVYREMRAVKIEIYLLADFELVHPTIFFPIFSSNAGFSNFVDDLNAILKILIGHQKRKERTLLVYGGFVLPKETCSGVARQHLAKKKVQNL